MINTAQLKSWVADPAKNPLTGNPIKTSGKIASMFRHKWEVACELENNRDMTTALPTDIIGEICDRQLKFVKLERIHRMLGNTLPKTICFQNTPFLSMINSESLEYYDIHDNSILTVFNGGFMMTFEHMSLIMETCTFLNGVTFIRAVINLLNMRRSSIDVDYQYTRKYGISKSFWKTINPKVEIEITVLSDKSTILNTRLFVENESIMDKFIPRVDLLRDMKANPIHPLLKAYRDGLRCFFHNLEHFTNIPMSVSNAGTHGLFNILKQFQETNNDFFGNDVDGRLESLYVLQDVLSTVQKDISNKKFNQWKIELFPYSIIKDLLVFEQIGPSDSSRHDVFPLATDANSEKRNRKEILHCLNASANQLYHIHSTKG